MRTSAFIEARPGTNILIDTSTDLRHQALAWGLGRVDAVLFTHSHADHILGIDDLRAFNFVQNMAIPCFGTAETLQDIRQMFSYVFNPNPLYQGGGVPKLITHEIDGVSPLEIAGTTIQPIPLMHGKLSVSGFRCGQLAYLTDTNSIPESSMTLLKGVRYLILDGLRMESHPSHFSIPEAVQVAALIGAEKTWLTHMTHTVDYASVNATLPAGIELAYDGLSIEFE